MSNINSESCALDANGVLKPASTISWYNDADDDAPMATISCAPTSALTASRSSSSLSQGTLNNYVRMTGSGTVPAGLVAGSRRSGHTSKPSAKICDAAPTISSIPAKRAATGFSTATTRKRTSVPDDTDIDTSSDGDALFESTMDEDDEMPDLQDCSDDKDEDDEDARLAAEEFDRNQALTDADRDVSHLSILLLLWAIIDSSWQARKGLKKDERTADLKTVFTEANGHVNPHTGELEDGWSCDVCRYAVRIVTEHYFHYEPHCRAEGHSEHASFFRGGISTRRTHIAR
jgi:hypothetical protein